MNILNNYRNFEDWFNENLGNRAKEIAENGADSGFTHLIYTNEMIEIFNHFQEEIWELVNTQAKEAGEQNVMNFIGTFTRFDMFDDFNSFKALLVWFAAEHYARQHENQKENDYIPF
jgi:hypothetical protein